MICATQVLTYAERMVHLGEDVLLVFNVIDVLALNDLVLLHGFYSELMSRVAAEPANLDKTEGT